MRPIYTMRHSCENATRSFSESVAGCGAGISKLRNWFKYTFLGSRNWKVTWSYVQYSTGKMDCFDVDEDSMLVWRSV